MWKTFFVELMLVTIKRIKKFAIYLQIEFFSSAEGLTKVSISVYFASCQKFLLNLN